MLEKVAHALNADFAYLSLYENQTLSEENSLCFGTLPRELHQELQTVILNVCQSKEPRLFDKFNLNAPEGIHGMIASPLLIFDQEVIGGLVLGNIRPEKLSHWDVTLVQAVSYQMALIAHFSQVLKKLEYQVVMAERARLAREVHDGIAQTLGFLKLMATQIDGYFQRGEFERLQKAINLNRNTLADAYMDARQAIDGLRITPEYGLQSWLEQAAEEYADNYDIPVHLVGLADVRIGLAPEVQAQLIRIVQEALTNVRKHAMADEIRIECRQWEGDFFLEIKDNGCGFEPEQTLKPSQHGMLGMRERAELIGADFQVTSIPQEGTRVQVRLPFQVHEIGAKL
jgi:two-component system nitrate/nitrite sensor histidine kinase NarX